MSKKIEVFLFFVIKCSGEIKKRSFTKPGLITLAIFTFLGNYRNLLWPLIMIKDAHLRTVPIGLLSFQGEYGSQIELLLAATVICIIPLIIMFILLQKRLVRGIHLGGGVRDKGWVLEASIPFSNFIELAKTKDLPPIPGSSWRINLNRWDGKEKRCLSQWSASDATWANPHKPHCFGIVVFLDSDRL